jgi:hypothetical protein
MPQPEQAILSTIRFLSPLMQFLAITDHWLQSSQSDFMSHRFKTPPQQIVITRTQDDHELSRTVGPSFPTISVRLLLTENAVSAESTSNLQWVHLLCQLTKQTPWCSPTLRGDCWRYLELWVMFQHFELYGFAQWSDLLLSVFLQKRDKRRRQYIPKDRQDIRSNRQSTQGT